MRAYVIMKKPYKGTVIGSSGKDCVLITLIQLYGSKPPPPTKPYLLRDLINFYESFGKNVTYDDIKSD